MDNNSSLKNNILNQDLDSSYIFEDLVGKSVEKIIYQTYGLLTKYKKLFLFIGNGQFYALEVNNNVQFVYGINFPDKDITIELPVGAFAKADRTELVPISTPINSEHFFSTQIIIH